MSLIQVSNLTFAYEGSYDDKTFCDKIATKVVQFYRNER